MMYRSWKEVGTQALGEEFRYEVDPSETANALPGLFFGCVIDWFPKGGDGLMMRELCIVEFVNWFCLHDTDIVGRPCSCFSSPLACWLSEFFGDGVYGIDGQSYGRALHEVWCWRRLPRWAVLFATWLERIASRPVTGREALEVLARVELALWSRAA